MGEVETSSGRKYPTTRVATGLSIGEWHQGPVLARRTCYPTCTPTCTMTVSRRVREAPIARRGGEIGVIYPLYLEHCAAPGPIRTKRKRQRQARGALFGVVLGPLRGVTALRASCMLISSHPSPARHPFSAPSLLSRRWQQRAAGVGEARTKPEAATETPAAVSALLFPHRHGMLYLRTS